MAIRRLFTECLLRPEDVPPTREDQEVLGVFNPGAAAVGDEVALMVRVAEAPRERREGYTALPRWSMGEGLVVDWVANDELEFLDPRIVRFRNTGIVRLTFVSYLRIYRCKDGRSIDSGGTLFGIESELEEYGVEDPRITRIGDTYYITYVAVSHYGVNTALASTRDFETFTRHGIIFHLENKDVVLFPEKVQGEYAALHRPDGATLFTTPQMWIARSPDLMNWGQHEPFNVGEGSFVTEKVGAGPPPILTDEGWLEIYHGAAKRSADDAVGAYSAGALLLDTRQPSRVLRGSPESIMVPEADFERKGFVSDVVFPTGIVERDDELLIYYGAADTATGVAGLSKKEILATLE